MSHVRHTPKRRRQACPECGRDIAYTTHRFGFRDRREVLTFSRHNRPDGAPCEVRPTSRSVVPRYEEVG